MSEPNAPIPPEELKKCPYCGHMTSVHANFCFYCARELVARPERPAVEETSGPVNWLVVLAIVAVFLLIVVVAALAITAK